MRKLAVFASGNGSNFQAIAEHFPVVFLFCDRHDAYVMERAHRLQVPVYHFSVQEFASKEAYEQTLVELLDQYQIDYVLLAGYMKVVGSTLLERYQGRIINIHPSYLPEFPGINAIARAFASGVSSSGVTVHYIDAGIDTGEIIRQVRVPIRSHDTLESFEERIHQAEHRLFVEVVKTLLPERRTKIKRALISVSEKQGIVELAQGLRELGWEIISTGGTKTALEVAGIDTIAIEEVTSFPEMMDGRVKTLHPKIHGGLLARRDQESHLQAAADHGIGLIDLVVVNLYPFKSTIQRPDVTYQMAVENIDIGGPSMLRSAAKNHASVTVVVDPEDYKVVLQELREHGDTTLITRKKLAAKVFRHTAAYDAIIAGYFTESVGETTPENLTITYNLQQSMRYGENSHQKAWFYQSAIPTPYSISSTQQLNGKELSFNNVKDADAAIRIIRDFHDRPTVVALKHMNPCGIGQGDTLEEAWGHAYAADPVSIFGGVVVVNREVTATVAAAMHELFLEIIIAPSYSHEALTILTNKKKNLRLLQLDFSRQDHSTIEKEYIGVLGGILVQDQDVIVEDETNWQVVTTRQPDASEMAAMRFGWKAIKYVKSNGIVITNDHMTLGIGPGQTNRVAAVKIAIEQAQGRLQGAILASDAFFPFPDNIEEIARAGIKAIIQPGGSVRDQESIEAANDHGITMIFTGIRHFRH